MAKTGPLTAGATTTAGMGLAVFPAPRGASPNLPTRPRRSGLLPRSFPSSEGRGCPPLCPAPHSAESPARGPEGWEPQQGVPLAPHGARGSHSSRDSRPQTTPHPEVNTGDPSLESTAPTVMLSPGSGGDDKLPPACSHSALPVSFPQAGMPRATSPGQQPPQLRARPQPVSQAVLTALHGVKARPRDWCPLPLSRLPAPLGENTFFLLFLEDEVSEITLHSASNCQHSTPALTRPAMMLVAKSIYKSLFPFPAMLVSFSRPKFLESKRQASK